MNALLDNRLAPLTFAIGFLEAPFQTAADESVAWLRSIHSRVSVASFESDLAGALTRLEPLITPPRKRLLAGTRSPWVAYFDNGTQGSDPDSFVGYMTRRLTCRGVTVTCSSAKTPGAPGGDARRSSTIALTLYASEPREWSNVERSVSVENDYGDWTFEATGTPQPFETVERYAARRVQDRFTPEMLDAYCQALGIRPFDERFYGPQAVLVSIGDALPPEFVPISLAEARARLGIDSHT